MNTSLAEKTAVENSLSWLKLYLLKPTHVKKTTEKFLPNVLNTGMCAYRILVFLAQPFAIQLSAEVVCLVMGQ